MSRTGSEAVREQDDAVLLAARWNLTEEVARRRYRRESDSLNGQFASEPDMKVAALWYARNGFPVFPLHYPWEGRCSCSKNDCESPGKHPLTPHGFKDATTDEARITGWWDTYPLANIGIPTGAPSQLLVMDCDPRNGRPADRSDLIEQVGPIPETAEVISGGGGRHVYFDYEGGPVPTTLAKGIDLKGDGGYVVAPPSMHISGVRYEVDGLQGVDAFLHLARIPPWLCDFVSSPRKSLRTENKTDGAKWGLGERNNRLTSMAGKLRRPGFSRGAMEAALLAENLQRCDPPLPEDEVRGIAASIARYPSVEFQDQDKPSGEWSDPIPFPTSTVDPIPLGSLPDWLGDMAQAVTESTETPFDLSSLLSLSVASACVAGKAEVSPEPGYVEPLNTFVCSAMDSGNRKTAVYSRLVAPLIEWEQEALARMEPERKRIASERLTLEKAIEHRRRKAAASPDIENLTREIQEMEGRLPTLPPIPRLYVDDCTPERLATLMAEQGGRMGVFSDEGGIFDLLAGRYSNSVPNLDLWLKGHSVSAVRVDRADRNRPPVMIDRPHLTVGLSPQPDVLQSLGSKPGFRGRGLLARFLFALPKSSLGYRTLEPRAVASDVQRRYRTGIHQLIELPLETPIRLTLSPAAYREWKDFQRAVELQFREGGQLESLRDWGSKLPGAALRIAGVSHMVKHAGRNEIAKTMDERNVTPALEMAACLISHAQCVFALMQCDPSIESALKLIGWIERQGQPGFTVRDCFREHQKLFRRMNAMMPVLSLLEQHLYIRRVQQASTGGRKPSDWCEVNPAVLILGPSV